MVRINTMTRVEKPWGYELIVEKTNKYALKDIFLRKGTRSSLQSHNLKLETIFVMSGIVELETFDADKNVHREIYKPGDAYTIQPTMLHRVTAIEDCRLIEVSTPELDDVVRYQDDFGRI